MPKEFGPTFARAISKRETGPGEEGERIDYAIFITETTGDGKKPGGSMGLRNRGGVHTCTDCLVPRKDGRDRRRSV